MDLIPSFAVDHTNLQPGIYISRQDEVNGAAITTYDIRMTAPNHEPCLNPAAIHTIEHLGATFLRNSSRKDEVIYFGPMGCRTGFYLVVFGKQSAEDVYPLVLEMCDFILGFEGEIPGAKPEECGNWSEQNLNMAKYYIRRYREDLTTCRRLSYPG